MTNVNVVSGDIAQVEADALITAINSSGMWFGGIDGVIQRAAGDLFHRQAAAGELVDGNAIVARGNGKAHRGKFAHVVFVVDDLKQQLRNVILAGLRAAEEAGFKSVTVPTIRMGVMLGAVEKTTQEAVNEMAEGVQTFLTESPTSVQHITFVVYNDRQTEALLRDTIKPPVN